jgi:lipopolysaccharide/colanic/teichoic acid biosynthesis glycosyltransferase
VRTLRLFIRFFLLLLILVTLTSLSKFHATYIGEYELASATRITWIGIYSVISFLIAYLFGLPEVSSWSNRVKASLAASMSTSLIVAFIQVLIGQVNLPRFVLLLMIPSLTLVFVFVSWVFHTLSSPSSVGDQILLICSDEDAETIAADVDYHCEVPCKIAYHRTPAEVVHLTDLNQFISDEKISLIVLNNESLMNDQILSIVSNVHLEGVRVRTQLSFYKDWIGKIPIRELGETALLFDVKEIHHVGYMRWSRLLDVTMSLFGLMALGLVVPVVYFGNLLGNQGPLFYRQPRIGKDRKVFQILKFRSMDSISKSTEWTKEDDTRVTRFGKWLRISHFDELPQVLNILRGELSVVGPRPEQPQYVDQLTRSIPYYQIRHTVKPGLTGWAQVNYPYGADEIDAFEKLQYEFWYLQHQSIWLDLRIIIRTFRHVLGFKGR